MSEPTDAELAQSMRSLSEAFGIGTETRKNLRLAAQRLEARGEITDSRLEAAIAAAKEWLEPPHDEINIRHAIGAALEAAQKGEA